MKERIKKAFVEEIQSHGMKFTMDHLAKRLGISKRTLYEHYSSKVEILEAIIDQSFQETDEQTERILQDESLTLLDKIRGVFTVVPSHNELLDLRILEQMKRYYPEQWSKVESALKDDWRMLRTLIEQGIREGIIQDMNVSLIMKLFIDAANSTLDQKFYMENNISAQEALHAIVDVLLYGLVPAHKQR